MNILSSLFHIKGQVYNPADSGRGTISNAVSDTLSGKAIDYSILPEAARESCRVAYEAALNFCNTHTKITKENLKYFRKCARLCRKAYIEIKSSIDVNERNVETTNQVIHYFTNIGISGVGTDDATVLDPDMGLYNNLKILATELPQSLIRLSEIRLDKTEKQSIEIKTMIHRIFNGVIPVQINGDPNGTIRSDDLHNICVNIRSNFEKYGVVGSGEIKFNFGEESWGIYTSNRTKTFKSESERPYSGGEGTKILEKIVEDSNGNIKINSKPFELVISNMQYVSKNIT